jgi:putative transcriptional regulator
MELKSNIQQLREAKRFSRPQLAQQVGISWETIKAYEVKGAYPSIHVAFKLAKALDCTVDDLFLEQAKADEAFDENMEREKSVEQDKEEDLNFLTQRSMQ